MKRITRPKASPLPVPVATLDARPDTVDFRDLMYVPTLVEVSVRLPLESYLACFPRRRVPILNQGREGACTGFGLAAVANYLLRRRRVVPDPTLVSPRMFYEMARRYDEWPGEAYSGSSARGAMKGWHKHGVCAATLWPYTPEDPGTLSNERASDAGKRPLGAYFRVNHRDLASLHSALAEVGILYATASVHQGWGKIDPVSGLIPGPEGQEILGGHAFAIVGYDERGFWLQNSWGSQWGRGGFALVTYEDWLLNSSDVWVARLGAPVVLQPKQRGRAVFTSVSRRAEYSFSDLRPHIISVGNDGALRDSGTFGTREPEVRTLLAEDFPRITRGWSRKRLLLYAHGGLVSEENALQRVAEYRQRLLEAEVYPLAFIWKTDFWTTVTNVLEDALRRRRPEGAVDAAKNFLLDRLDDTLEPLARPLGRLLWKEMKENALLATSNPVGGARLVLEEISQLLRRTPEVELHVAGHSAGSIFLAPLVQALTSPRGVSIGPLGGVRGLGARVATCALWAPACTMKLFRATYLPAIEAGAVQRFTLFTLKNPAECDDHCAQLYHKSLLYLVAHAFEEKARAFFGEGEPLLGMEKFILKDPSFQVDPDYVAEQNPPVMRLFGLDGAEWVRSPNGLPEGEPISSTARRHGDFDDDPATLKATLARMLAARKVRAEFVFQSSTSALEDRRRTVQRRD